MDNGTIGGQVKATEQGEREEEREEGEREGRGGKAEQAGHLVTVVWALVFTYGPPGILSTQPSLFSAR